MKIVTKKYKNKKSYWRADFVEIPGSPAIGEGRTKAEAIACLFIRNKSNFDRLSFDSLIIDNKPWSLETS